jgi:hypothetical protein
MRRRVIIEPELRQCVCRWSQHRPWGEINMILDEEDGSLRVDPEGAPAAPSSKPSKVEKVGTKLTEEEYILMKRKFANPDVARVLVVEEQEGDEEKRRRMTSETRTLVKDRNMAMTMLIEGIESELLLHNPGAKVWEECPKHWSEFLFDLGSHTPDDNIIQTESCLRVVRGVLLRGVLTEEGHSCLNLKAPIVGRLFDHFRKAGLPLPFFAVPVLFQLYKLAVWGRGGVGLGAWADDALVKMDKAYQVALKVNYNFSNLAEDQAAVRACFAEADEAMDRLERFDPPPGISANEATRLQKALGHDAEPLENFLNEGESLCDHPFWSKKRGLPRYVNLEDEVGKSKTASEEHKCSSGKTIMEVNAAEVLKEKERQKGKKAPTRGGYIFVCPHRAYYGMHFMLRGESTRDMFAVLFTRFHRHQLPDFVFADNNCIGQNYCMRREPLFFSNVKFVIDKFHYGKPGSKEAHVCGPSFSSFYYSCLQWANTSSAESLNSFLDSFRTLGWYNGLDGFLILFRLLLNEYNENLARIDNPSLRIAGPGNKWVPRIATFLLQN